MKNILLIFLFFSLSAIAHEDTVISLSSDGSLIGLPAEFLPAQLNLSTNRISIGKYVLFMPICVSKYFKNPGSYKLFITSSWYHERSVLPPYINFEIKPINKDYEFKLLFNLNDLSPLQFIVVTYPNEKESSYNDLEISNECRFEIEKSTTKSNS